ncbi:hypothetical protein ACODT5_28895 [Streptomyces sp. 5.8]|uniref:hypothetical protein n=1 Tax=Streptomyces sp. 5.8 TaxID=3406571 RepID=UPI003BB4C0C7
MPHDMTGVLAFERIASRLAGRATSDSMRDKFLWIGTEMKRAAELGLLPEDSTASLDRLLTNQIQAVYLVAADAGRLRRPGWPAGPSREGTRASRRRILRAIIREAQVGAMPGKVAMPDLLPPVTEEQWQQIVHVMTAPPPWHFLAASPLAAARVAAYACLFRATGTRTSQIDSLTLDNLPDYTPDDPATPTLVTWGDNAQPLDDLDRRLLRRWLRVRQSLVATLEGTPHKHLWVAIATQGAGSTGRAIHAGSPLAGPHVLRDAYISAVRAVNLHCQNDEGWEPIPTGLDQLRRGAGGRKKYSAPQAVPLAS